MSDKPEKSDRSLASEQLEDLKPQPFLDVRNVEFRVPELSLEFPELFAHISFELVPGGDGSG